ncbi:hypothetical protein H5410_012607 [Solanum commersonii]|uniref:Uncharacterized protein n=1 Tax=Solanum commersonii TaxID=4109 RepID=A0A9J6AS39_SOLCO|nr:hypothetical protein H5410_012607 [Solanum commersonii]
MKPLEMMLKTLKVYEEIYGQLLNKDKSCFAVANNTKATNINWLENITNMKHQLFPIRYLDCPLIIGKNKISHYSYMGKTVEVSIIGPLGRNCATLIRKVEQTLEILMTRVMLFKQNNDGTSEPQLLYRGIS